MTSLSNIKTEGCKRWLLGIFICFFCNPANAETTTKTSTVEFTELLETAFSSDDLTNLAEKSGMNDCYTYIDKNLVNDSAGRDTAKHCIERKEHSYFKSLSLQALENEGANPAQATPNKLQTQIANAAIERFSERYFSKIISNNKFLASLTSGKINIELSPQSFFSIFHPKAEIRPKYSLTAMEQNPQSQSKRIASLVPIDGSTISSGDAIKNSHKDYKIIEDWSTSSLENYVPLVPKEKSMMSKWVTNTFGLSTVPFTKFNLNVEKAGGLRAIKLTLDEGAGLGSVDLTPLLHKKFDEITWKFKFPFQKHAFIIHQDGFKNRKYYTYEYLAGSNFSTTLGLNPNHIAQDADTESAFMTAGLYFSL